MKHFRILIICVLVIFLFLSSCDGQNNPDLDVTEGVGGQIIVDNIKVVVLSVQLRRSVQTHYLMHYPKPDHVFLEVSFSFEDFDSSPTELVDWGTQHIILNCDGSEPSLAFARRVITDEQVEYKVGEVLNFDYVYIYDVLKNSDFRTCEISFSDGQSFSISELMMISRNLIIPSSTDQKGTVLGGINNQANGENAVICGGTKNIANAIHATVSGGSMNTATTSHSTVGGGRENLAKGFYATVGGGYANVASARDTFIGAGSRNTASGSRATVGGGIQNHASAPDTIIGGGAYNDALDNYAFVGGGTRNIAAGYGSVVSGGAGNSADNDHSTISGGLANQVDSNYGTVSGGYRNIVTGDYSTIPGGFGNVVEGNHSFAVGQLSKVPEEHYGTFLYSDAVGLEFTSIKPNEFAVRATGGVRFISAVEADGTIISGVRLYSGSGSWATLSDQSVKTDIKSVNRREILEKVIDLPIATWRYIGQSRSVQHIGPMSQDFYRSFGFGEDTRYINTVDSDGVALTAIQGLYEIIEEQETMINHQREILGNIESRLTELEDYGSREGNNKPGAVFWLLCGNLIGSFAMFLGFKCKSYFSGLSRRRP